MRLPYPSYFFPSKTNSATSPHSPRPFFHEDEGIQSNLARPLVKTYAPLSRLRKVKVPNKSSEVFKVRDKSPEVRAVPGKKRRKEDKQQATFYHISELGRILSLTKEVDRNTRECLCPFPFFPFRKQETKHKEKRNRA